MTGVAVTREMTRGRGPPPGLEGNSSQLIPLSTLFTLPALSSNIQMFSFLYKEKLFTKSVCAKTCITKKSHFLEAIYGSKSGLDFGDGTIDFSHM